MVDPVNGSDVVTTYEDKDGDWMLVGDVPWEYVTSFLRPLPPYLLPDLWAHDQNAIKRGPHLSFSVWLIDYPAGCLLIHANA